MKHFKFYALKLVGLTFIVFLLQVFFGKDFTNMFSLVANVAWQEPWRFLTPIFLHGGVGHFLTNMFGLALFGSLLEKVIGAKRFLFVYIGTGIIANLISVNFYPASLGASGAVFGVLGCLAVLRPNLVVWISYMPMPMWLAIFVWAAIDLLGVFYPSGTGNIAHLVGMISGIALGFFWSRRFGKYKRKRNKQKVISNDEFRFWESRYMRQGQKR
jgi:uncharacterized protein